MQQTLIFLPLHLLVRCAMAMLYPVRLCAVEDGRHGRPDLRREEVRWYSDRYPSLLRYGCRRGAMTGVMLSQGMVPVLLLTVHGHVRPIGGSGCRGWGGPVAHHLARGLHVSLGRDRSKLRGSVLLMTPRGLGRGGEMSPDTLISSETSPQGSGGMEFFVRAASD
jgi:hypothetical protein